MARDVSEFLDHYDIGAPKRWSSLKVAYHRRLLVCSTDSA